MARSLYAASHLTPQAIDAVCEEAERAALIECARRTKKKVYLKNGSGPDTSEILSQLTAREPDSELLFRQVLPDTDLNAGAVAFDQWQTAALVAGTDYLFINQQLRTDQVCVLFGVATLDANPCISRVRCLQGSVALAAWDATPLWAAQDTMGYADEFAMWSVQETVAVWLMPFITKAGGERFIVLGGIAEPKGSGPVTK